MERRKLNEAEISSRIETMPGWVHDDGRLRKLVATGNFNRGVQYVLKIGAIADRLNHHPDILLTYPRVTIEIYTHDVGGITDFDFELARQIDGIQP